MQQSTWFFTLWKQEMQNTFASWGVDYLKYENCYDDGTKPEARFPPMRDALNATGRPIFLAIRGKSTN